eukprot:m.526793 g.526793  ORF g.526793 m.526793 type:complete len:365 (-) comp22005_c1_seq3:282-1376(-)
MALQQEPGHSARETICYSILSSTDDDSDPDDGKIEGTKGAPAISSPPHDDIKDVSSPRSVNSANTIADDAHVDQNKFSDARNYRRHLAVTCRAHQKLIRAKRRRARRIAEAMPAEIEKRSSHQTERIPRHVLDVPPQPEEEVNLYSLYNYVTSEDRVQLERSNKDGFLMKLLTTWATQSGMRIPSTPQYSHPHDHWPAHFTIGVRFIGGLLFQAFRLRAMWFLSSRDPAIQTALSNATFINPLLKFFQMSPHGGLELLPYQHTVLSFVEFSSNIVALELHNISIRTIMLIAFDVFCLLFFNKKSHIVTAARVRLCTVPQGVACTTVCHMRGSSDKCGSAMLVYLCHERDRRRVSLCSVCTRFIF